MVNKNGLSGILTRDLIEKALDIVNGSVLFAVDSGLFKRPTLAVVVKIKDRPDLTCERWLVTSGKEDRFMVIAHGKADLSDRTGMSTEKVVNKYPHLLNPQDPKYAGGVHEAGISVGCSAQQAYFDQMVAEWIISTIIALSKDVIATKVLSASADFVSQCLDAE